jgi:hypothetical protein
MPTNLLQVADTQGVPIYQFDLKMLPFTNILADPQKLKDYQPEQRQIVP